MSSYEDRTGRADARLNAAKVLAAADATYALSGTDLQMGEVAERAGVGVATVYRTFPSKDALLRALAEERFAGFLRLADETLARPDTKQAFVSFFLRIAHLFKGDVGLRWLIASLPAQDRPCQAEEMTNRLRDLHERAANAGFLRTNVSVADLQALVGALSGAAGTDVSSERTVELLLPGVLATGVLEPALLLSSRPTTEGSAPRLGRDS